MYTLIGLHGPSGAGKNTVARCGNAVFEFSLGLKTALSTILPRAYNLVHDGIDRAQKEQVRPLMITYGELMCEIIDKYVWVRDTMTNIAKCIDEHRDRDVLILVTDARKLIETQAIKAFGGHVVEITRPGVDYAPGEEAAWHEEVVKAGVIEHTYENKGDRSTAHGDFRQALVDWGY